MPSHETDRVLMAVEDLFLKQQGRDRSHTIGDNTYNSHSSLHLQSVLSSSTALQLLSIPGGSNARLKFLRAKLAARRILTSAWERFFVSQTRLYKGFFCGGFKGVPKRGTQNRRAACNYLGCELLGCQVRVLRFVS